MCMPRRARRPGDLCPGLVAPCRRLASSPKGCATLRQSHGTTAAAPAASSSAIGVMGPAHGGPGRLADMPPSLAQPLGAGLLPDGGMVVQKRCARPRAALLERCARGPPAPPSAEARGAGGLRPLSALGQRDVPQGRQPRAEPGALMDETPSGLSELWERPCLGLSGRPGLLLLNSAAGSDVPRDLIERPKRKKVRKFAKSGEIAFQPPLVISATSPRDWATRIVWRLANWPLILALMQISGAVVSLAEQWEDVFEQETP